MSVPLGLSALGIVTPLGTGKLAVAAALFKGQKDGLVLRSDLIHGQDVYVGVVPDPLPSLPPSMAIFDCRNNRLMLAALLEIEDAVSAVIYQFGRKRIAVVLGTSTSGIAETEIAFKQHIKSGAWPEKFDYRQHEAGGAGEIRCGLVGSFRPSLYRYDCLFLQRKSICLSPTPN
jgi:3-oxoacyl-[acyl-carrier-protein] synthase-1